MLRRDQIRVKFRGKHIEPQYIDRTRPAMLDRAASLLELFDRACAERWTRDQLEDGLHALEGLDPSHRLLKGMAKVLLDKCTFEADSPVEPSTLRQLVFQRAAETGPLALRPGPLARRTAADVWAEVAAELPTVDGRQWTVSELESALYADLPGQQKLTDRSGPQTPAALIDRYNVALVQALLLRTHALTVRMQRPEAKRVRQLFRYLKFHQLMYRVSGSAEELVLTVDGPQSLLKQSNRYGLQLAVFFPAIVLQTGGWTVEAEVLWGQKRKLKKQLTVSDQHKLRSHYRDIGAWTSKTEQWFLQRFAALDTGWQVRPGELIDLGRQRVLVPDLKLEKDGRVAYLDIVGFWRRAYLEQRIAETPNHVVLAVSKRLMGDKSALPKSLADRVVPFAEIISAKSVLQKIEACAIQR